MTIMDEEKFMEIIKAQNWYQLEKGIYGQVNNGSLKRKAIRHWKKLKEIKDLFAQIGIGVEVKELEEKGKED